MGLAKSKNDNVDEAWGELAKKRLLELESGSVKSISWKKVKKEVRNPGYWNERT